MDFTIEKYKFLLYSILNHGYQIARVKDVIDDPNELNNNIILKHDIDKKPQNALTMALIEEKLGVKASYYFRTTSEVYKENIIKKIFDMGHEIGYHYEVLAKSNGNYEKAIKLFEMELEDFQDIVPVETICMHGSPLSKWNEIDLWNKINFLDYKIKGDAMISFDFTELAYFTDTGRRWDGEKFIIRDRVNKQSQWDVNTTNDLISLLEARNLNNAMLNIHCQRWNDKFAPWIFELFGQNIKNVGKMMLRKLR